MEVIIEKIEGDIIVLELPDKSTVNAPSKLFKDAMEGDVFDIIKSDEKTKNKQEKIKNLMNEIFK